MWKIETSDPETPYPRQLLNVLAPANVLKDSELTAIIVPDQAKGKEALRGPAYHQRLLPAHTQLKYRKPGQGGSADCQTRDLAAELLAAEAKHFSKNSRPFSSHKDEDEDDIQSRHSEVGNSNKRRLSTSSPSQDDGGEDQDAENGDEDPNMKRRRILAETRDIDADDSDEDDSSGSDSSDSDSDSEDEQEELMRELERVKREKALKREKEEAERRQAEEDARVRDIARGNPLLNKADFTMKRRWDDDVVFKNQARGTDDRNKPKEFINDMLRSDFHKRFMNKYVR